MIWDGADIEKKELPAPLADTQSAPSSIVDGYGPGPTPRQQLYVISPAEWEQFICEWGTLHKAKAHLVARIGGANDRGVDVAIFYDSNLFDGNWECCQCKFYSNPLTSGDARLEIAKLLWNIQRGKLSAPSRYTFFAPKDCGEPLRRLLLNPDLLKDDVIGKWTKGLANQISSSAKPTLEGDLLDFVKSFDFSIFQYKPTEQLLVEHAKTVYNASRFYAVSPRRPSPPLPPVEDTEKEAVYLGKLKAAYAEHKDIDVNSFDVSSDPDLLEHRDRQRQAFFCAEALDKFARDNHPPETYDQVQNEVFAGVVDIAKFASHANGFSRLNAVLSGAGNMQFPSSLLAKVIKEQDKRGICHKLANDNRLDWVDS